MSLSIKPKPVLSKEEQNELFVIMKPLIDEVKALDLKHPTKELLLKHREAAKARDNLIMSLLGVVIKVATKYRVPANKLDEVIVSAMPQISRSIILYNSASGTKFSSYSYMFIVGAVIDYVKKELTWEKSTQQFPDCPMATENIINAASEVNYVTKLVALLDDVEYSKLSFMLGLTNWTISDLVEQNMIVTEKDAEAIFTKLAILGGDY